MSCFRIQIETCRTRLFLIFFLKTLDCVDWHGAIPYQQSTKSIHTTQFSRLVCKIQNTYCSSRYNLHVTASQSLYTCMRALLRVANSAVSSFVITNQSHCCLQQLLVWASCMATLNNQLLFDSQSIVLTSQTMAS